MPVLNANRETDHEEMNSVNDSDKKVHLIAQELKLAKILSGNDFKAREKVLKSLGKWFENRSKTIPFTNEDFQRIWKGLFFCMWMSDKPLLQEDCANKIARLVHMPNLDASLLFFRAGLTILSNEWFGIDQLRLDKFLMLVRRLLRETLITLRSHKLNSENIKKFNEVLSDTILSSDAMPPLGLFMHYVEIFLEELAKVTEGKIQPDNTVQLLEPFIKILVFSDDGRKKGHIRKFIFTYLIRQSNLGLEYQDKYNAWKQEGFPGNIDSMQKIKLKNDEKMSSDEEEISAHDKPLDPRAGRIDVEIPQIKFISKGVAAALLEYRFHKNSSPKSRKIITSLAEQFTKLANGIYPLGVKKVRTIEETDFNLNIRKAANDLIKFDQKLLGKNRKRKIVKGNDDEAQIEKRRKITEKLSVDISSEKRKESNCKERELEITGESTKEQKMASTKVNNKSNRSDGGRNAHVNIPDNRKKKFKSSRSLKSDQETQDLKNIECILERNSGVWVIQVDDKNKKAKVSLQSDFTSSSSEILKGPSISSGSTDSFANKRVTINTRLNRTQEVHEHHAQILSSPGIPYDAHKKPSKPLLKRSNASPINPFYKNKTFKCNF